MEESHYWCLISLCYQLYLEHFVLANELWQLKIVFRLFYIVVLNPVKWFIDLVFLSFAIRYQHTIFLVILEICFFFFFPFFPAHNFEDGGKRQNLCLTGGNSEQTGWCNKSFSIVNISTRSMIKFHCDDFELHHYISSTANRLSVFHLACCFASPLNHRIFIFIRFHEKNCHHSLCYIYISSLVVLFGGALCWLVLLITWNVIALYSQFMTSVSSQC